MKFFKKIILILVAISLSTLFIGCPPKPTEEIIEKTIEEVTTTEEAELKTEEEAEEITRELTEETTEEEITEATEKIGREYKVNEEVEEFLKIEVVPVLEKDFRIKVNKAKYQNETLYLDYETKWAVEETMQKEMFNIIQALSIVFAFAENYGFEISATSKFADIIKSETSQEIQDHFLNIEISFEEWVEKCIIK